MFNSNNEIVNVNQYINNHKKKFNIEIGAKIREYRKSNNITTEQLAFRSIMSPSYIIQLENGIYGLTLNKFIIICNALEIEPNYFLDEFIYGSKKNKDILYNELQNNKNISKNIINYLKDKESGYMY